MHAFINFVQVNASSSTTNDRRRDERGRRDDPNRRASAQIQQSGVVPPSPALVRAGSNRRKVPNALIPGITNSGAVTPQSAAAQVGVPAPGVMSRRMSKQQQHPYATGESSYQEAEGDARYSTAGGNGNGMGGYGGTTAMSSSKPPDVSRDVGDRYDQQQVMDHEVKQPLIVRILTCRC